MAEPARHLHLVDSATHEILPLTDCPSCAVKDDEIKGLQRDIRGWAARYAELERDRDAEARASKHWPRAIEVFRAWQTATGKTRTGWTTDRFALVEPFLRKRAYGYEMCLRAVAGIAFDHYTGERKNGTAIHYHEWERCFKDAGQLERFANAAPQGWRDDPVFAAALRAFG